MNAIAGKEELRRDRSAMQSALGEAGVTDWRGNVCRCPFHDDKHASAGIYQDKKTGAWMFKCQTLTCAFGGDVFDVRAKLAGVTPAHVLREFNAKHKPQAPERKTPRRYSSLDELKASYGEALEDCYLYTNPATRTPDMVVVRLRQPGGGKTFHQCRPDGSGFALEAPPKPWPLYLRHAIAAADSVIVVEGEKCAKVLHSLGFAATTSPGGAGKAAHADWSPLAGKVVYLWPDNDPEPASGEPTGVRHMRDVARILESLTPPATLQWINPASLRLPDKGDCVEYLAQFEQADTETKKLAINDVLDGSEPIGVGREVHDEIEATIAGQRRTVAWTHPQLSRLTKALRPGTVTVLCGEAGSSKSFFVLQQMWWWHERGIPVALMELEDDRKFHLMRMLAQRSGISSLTDPEWIEANPDQARKAMAENREVMDSFGRCVFDSPDDALQLPMLEKWIEERAAAGAMVIAVDPITAAAKGAQPWEDDRRFILRTKAIMRQHGASLILVTHPKGGPHGRPNMDNLAGGQAFTRFPQTILWLMRHQPAKDLTVIQYSLAGSMRSCKPVDAVVRICKVRSAPGGGRELAFTFDTESLTFLELGGVARDEQ